jgi:hypothetical protein
MRWPRVLVNCQWQRGLSINYCMNDDERVQVTRRQNGWTRVLHKPAYIVTASNSCLCQCLFELLQTPGCNPHNLRLTLEGCLLHHRASVAHSNNY